MSPALLSRRLKELETAGIVAREASASDPGVLEYHLTESGRELGPLVEAFGIWGQRRIEANLSLQHLDVDLLMWDMRRNLNTTPMPARRSVVEFVYPAAAGNALRRFWLIVDPELGNDLCKIDPGFEVDLYVSADLRSMTAIWLGTGYRARCRREPADGADRQPAARGFHADLARSQPVREGTQARELKPSIAFVPQAPSAQAIQYSS